MDDDRIRAAMRWVLALFFVAAGVAHLLVPEKLLAITPSWVPFAPLSACHRLVGAVQRARDRLAVASMQVAAGIRG